MDSDIDFSGFTSVVALSSGVNMTSIDAGFYKGECLNGVVWKENPALPFNSVYDSYDILLEGIQVDLVLDTDITKSEDDVLFKTTITGSNGEYQFDNIPIGQYFLIMHPPVELSVVDINVGNNAMIDNDFYYNPESDTIRSLLISISSQLDNICIADIDGGFKLQPVPLDLISFEAEWIEEKAYVEIYWETTNEINLDKYVLERRSELESNYVEIARIKANESREINKYNVIDPKINRGMRYYYKLRPIDNDGNENENKKDEVLIPGEKMEVLAYPNPTKSVLNIAIIGKSNEKVNIEILDITGRLAMKEIEIEKNSNNTEKVSIDVSELPQGQYFIKVFSDNQEDVKTVTIIK